MTRLRLRLGLSALALRSLTFAGALILVLLSLGACQGDEASTEWETEGEEETPGAYEALVLWTEQRAYPTSELPAEGYARALDRLAEMRAEAPAERPGAEAGWQAIGPHNFAGRMLAVALNPLNPHTVWAGSASGGLWRSATEGLGEAAWERVPLGFGALAVSTIAVHPADSLTLYVGTGEVYRYRDTHGGVTFRPTRGSYGVGILKTTDGGATWAHALDWTRNQERGVQMLRLDPTDPSIVWAATTEGVLVSRDGGATWATSLNVPLATDVSVNPAAPQEVVAACGNQQSPGYGIYRTTDGGANWTRVTTGVPPSYVGKVLFDRHPTQPATVFASVGNGVNGNGSTWLLRSADGGASWSTVTTTNYATFQGWFAHYVAVDPHDPNVVLLAGVDMWRSTQGGANPVQISSYGGPLYPPVGGHDGSPTQMHPDNHHFAFHPTQPGVVYFANDGGIYRSTDSGQTYTAANGGLQTTQFYNGASVSAQDPNQMTGGVQDQGVFIWRGDTRWYRPLGGDGTWTATDPRTPERVYGALQYLAIRRSEDGGQSFVNIAPPASAPGFVAPYALAPSMPDRLYAAGSVVYRSENRGDAWTATNGGAAVDPSGNDALALAVAPSDAGVVYLTTSPNSRFPSDTPGPPKLFVTTNAGANWTNRTAGLPDRFLTDVAVHPSDPQTAYVTASGFGSGHVFQTADGGATWTDVTNGLPDIPASAVVLDPLAPDHVYVGTDVGVFVSIDAGVTWAPWDTGLVEAVMVADLVVSPADRTIRALTHGNGAFLRPLAETPTASGPGAAPEAALTLTAVGPNPFRDRTVVEVRLPRESLLRLTLYDAAGRQVAVLADGQRAAGSHRIPVDGRALAPGVYVARLASARTGAALRLTRAR
ncbi:MAG TPA: hypothetical protein VGB53_10990 [Rubricoccaceae bacterium]|jgi:photosystem II stability/assembly factor-like uncharacterized protein